MVILAWCFIWPHNSVTSFGRQANVGAGVDCEDCFYVLDNLSVAGLDFHTVPDGVAPHSHRHPHWVPHPSRWSVELLLLACSFPSALECLSLPSRWRGFFVTIGGGSELCVYFPCCFLLSHETHTLVSKRIHPCWLPLGLQVFSCLGGASQQWVDPRLLFCECPPPLWFVFLVSASVNTEIPSILGEA